MIWILVLCPDRSAPLIGVEIAQPDVINPVCSLVKFNANGNTSSLAAAGGGGAEAAVITKVALADSRFSPSITLMEDFIGNVRKKNIGLFVNQTKFGPSRDPERRAQVFGSLLYYEPVNEVAEGNRDSLIIKDGFFPKIRTEAQTRRIAAANHPPIVAAGSGNL